MKYLYALLAFMACCWSMSLVKAGYVYESPVNGPAFLDEEQELQVPQQFHTLAENYAEKMLSGSTAEKSQYGIEVDEPFMFSGLDESSDDERRPNNKCAQLSCFCGTPNVKRIIGGTRVQQNKYPWTAQMVKGRWYPRLFCGGSLINDRYVLTAGHCVHNNRDQITIRLLQLDRSSQTPGVTRKVMDTILHPNYDPNKIQNDIALLKMDTRVQFGPHIRPVCLPNPNHNFDGVDAIVAGWGLLKEGGSTSNYLNEVTVPIITNAECRTTRYKNKITENMLCAGVVPTGGKDACQGDSGGPLIVNEGRYKLAGVVSFGFGCAQPNAPGVYTRVSKYLPWIRNNTKDACYCPS